MGGRLLEGPTMVGRTLDWQDELERWLKPFLGRLGHKARRRMCPLYVSGLIGAGEATCAEGRRRTTTADQGQGSATSAWGRGLANQRTQDVRREEILSRQPAGEHRPAHLSGRHQGAMDLRTGSPADERRTRS